MVIRSAMERALLITIDTGSDKKWEAFERSAELEELAYSAGAKVIRSETVKRHMIDPALYIGKGKAQELSAVCADERIATVIFNNDLSGSQQKNLERALRVKIVDRTQLILDIFARRAHTNEGKLQVELAQLLYMLPRLTGRGTELSRLGGGIGTRGPGEQKLETDRRRIRDRISHLKKELEGLRTRREMVRKKRTRFSVLTIAIIGYTNVGKSTLLNALTSSDVVSEDRLFSTLDPTIRQFMLPNKQKVLFVDTVGFLDRLPHNLIEAFKATLEEVVEADILLHLIDASHKKAPEQAEAVTKVLDEIGAGDKPFIIALNKIDKISDNSEMTVLKNRFPEAVAISALKRRGFDELVGKMLFHIKDLTARVGLTLNASDVKKVALIYDNGIVLKREYKEDKIYIEAEIPTRLIPLLKEKTNI